MGLVVGAALVRDGRVLAARRTWPAEHAGRWELPGGKVEPGETPEQALVRELREELGLDTTVVDWLRGEQPVAGGRHTLRVALVTLDDPRQQPRLVDHDDLRWLGPDALGPDALGPDALGPDAPHPDAVDWLEPDRPFLAELRDRLQHDPAAPSATPAPADPTTPDHPHPRGIFFDEDHARAVVRHLEADGFRADLARERFAGEDDDEDHPWAVTTDAPEFVLEVLVDRWDGWLEAPEPQVAPYRPASTLRTPLDLPDAPRRLKRPPV